MSRVLLSWFLGQKGLIHMDKRKILKMAQRKDGLMTWFQHKSLVERN